MSAKSSVLNEPNQSVFAEQVRLTYAQTIKLMIGGVATQLIFCAMVWDEIDHVYVLSWYALIVFLSVIRIMFYLVFNKQKDRGLNLEFWNSAYIFLAFVYSSAMGSISVVLHLTDDTTYHFLVVAWLVGASALAVSSYTMNFRTALAAFTPMPAILAGSLIVAGTLLHLLTAVVLFIWIFIVLNTMRPVSQSMIRALIVNHQLALEIEQREKLEQQLRELSIRDGLTGLYNRRYFDIVYSEELKRAERARTELSIVLIDIDCFKQFKDKNRGLSPIYYLN